MTATSRTGLNAACVFALLLSAAVSAGAQSQGAAPAGRGVGSAATLKEARKYLQGRWGLESLELRQPGKAPVVIKGSGVLDYDDFGNLRMEIRADQASSDLLRAAGMNIRDGFVSTEGRTAIDLQNRTLTYFIEGQPARAEGALAMNRPRHWEVTSDVLTLTTKDDTGAPMAISRWRKSK